MLADWRVLREVLTNSLDLLIMALAGFWRELEYGGGD
tara:strand:- start:221 stop:331 length:111 start_codon:yes stop_codon:yes gene_type:complete